MPRSCAYSRLEKLQPEKEEKTLAPQLTKISSHICLFVVSILAFLVLLLYVATFTLIICAVVNNNISKPIKEAIRGDWKLIEYLNFEGVDRDRKEEFWAELNFDVLPDGRIVQTDKGYGQMIEGRGGKDGEYNYHYEEDNHLRSNDSTSVIQDLYVENGKLIRFNFQPGKVFKRVYQKI